MLLEQTELGECLITLATVVSAFTDTHLLRLLGLYHSLIIAVLILYNEAVLQLSNTCEYHCISTQDQKPNLMGVLVTC